MKTYDLKLKKFLPLIVLLVGLGVIASLLAYFGKRAVMPLGLHSIVTDEARQMEWLRCEFKLNDQQYEKILMLHREYKPHCEEMCARIFRAREKVESLIASRASRSLELDEALSYQAQVQKECQQHVLDHIYRVAAEMSPDQAERYLKLMKSVVSRTN